MFFSRVSISEPVKVGEGLSAHTAYKLTVALAERAPGLDALSYTTLRRFSDFAWLRAQLREIFPYLIVPALPDKQQLGRFGAEFVDMRQRALQRWIERVAAHPELSASGARRAACAGRARERGAERKAYGATLPPPPLLPSDLFKRFISVSPEAMAMLRDGGGSHAQALVMGTVDKSKKVILRLFKSATVLASDAYAQARGVQGTVVSGASASAQDVAFAEVDAYLAAQAPLVATLYSAAAVLANRNREQAQVLLAYGSSLRELGAAERAEAPAAGDALATVGVASWAASTTSYEQSVCLTEALVEKLADFVRNARAVKDAVAERARASAQLSDVSAEVDRLRALLTALGSSASPNAARDRSVAEADMAAAARALVDARAYYSKVSDALLSEVDRLREAMRTDFRTMLLQFAATQVRSEQKLAAAWESISAKIAVSVPAASAAVAAAL